MTRTALLTWEIGLGFGHVMPMLPVARELKARGWRVVFALRDVREAGALLKQEGFEALQAPCHPDRLIARHEPQPQSMADVLALFGFAHENHLRGLVHSWQSLFDLLQPDLLVASYAPLSLLCARLQGIPTQLLALPFELPPKKHPLPSFRQASSGQSDVTDKQVIATVNAVLGQRSIGAVHEVFHADQVSLLCFPELDAWGPRPDTSYLGAFYTLDVGQPPVWKNTGRNKTLAYLTTELPQLEMLRQDLLSSPHEFLLYLRGATDAQLTTWKAGHIQAVNTPLQLGAALTQCEAVLSYAGMGMTSASLMAGKPGVYVTRDLEGSQTASQVERLGAGLHLNRRKGVSPSELLSRVLAQPTYAQAAKRFAAMYAQHQPMQVSQEILQALSEIPGLAIAGLLKPQQSASIL